MNSSKWFTGVGFTGGLVRALKAVTVDVNKDVGTFRNVRSTRFISQEGAPSTAAMAGHEVLTAAMILGGIIVRDPGGAGRNLTWPTAAALVAALPNAAVGDVIDTLIVNGADAAEVLTLVADATGGFDANQTAASRVIGQNSSKLVRTRITGIGGSAAYVIYG